MNYFIFFILSLTCSNIFALNEKDITHLKSYGASKSLLHNMQMNSNFYFSKSLDEHEIIILDRGPSAFAKRLEMIDRAKESIDMEYFIFDLDKTTKFLVKKLVEKAKAGVKVRLLLDHFAVSGEFSPFFAHYLQKNGIEVRYYNTSSLTMIISAQYRNHRKLFSIDRKEAIVGGRNISDAYFEVSDKYNFIDREIWIEGAVVKDINFSFDQIWKSKVTKTVYRPRFPRWADNSSKIAGSSKRSQMKFRMAKKKWRDNRKKAKNFFKYSKNELDFFEKFRTFGDELLQSEKSTTCSSLTFVSDRPRNKPIQKKRNRMVRKEVYKRMKNANDSIVIDSSYIIFDDFSGPIIKKALKENVDVQIFTNGMQSTDQKIVVNAFTTVVDDYLDLGLKGYIMKGNSIPGDRQFSNKVSRSNFGTHSKTYLIDHHTTMIGSYNFDARSNYFSIEMALFCNDSAEFARIIRESIKRRMSPSTSYFVDSDNSLDKVKLKGLSFFDKFSYYILKIPAYILRDLF